MHHHQHSEPDTRSDPCFYSPLTAGNRFYQSESWWKYVMPGQITLLLMSANTLLWRLSTRIYNLSLLLTKPDKDLQDKELQIFHISSNIPVSVITSELITRVLIRICRFLSSLSGECRVHLFCFCIILKHDFLPRLTSMNLDSRIFLIYMNDQINKVSSTLKWEYESQTQSKFFFIHQKLICHPWCESMTHVKEE